MESEASSTPKVRLLPTSQILLISLYTLISPVPDISSLEFENARSTGRFDHSKTNGYHISIASPEGWAGVVFAIDSDITLHRTQGYEQFREVHSGLYLFMDLASGRIRLSVSFTEAGNSPSRCHQWQPVLYTQWCLSGKDTILLALRMEGRPFDWIFFSLSAFESVCVSKPHPLILFGWWWREMDVCWA
jgi:hypothetical protein